VPFRLLIAGQDSERDKLRDEVKEKQSVVFIPHPSALIPAVRY
jgi:hypothetical protein